ncbi:PDZ domain-containing secreted protein [Streptomyces sp. TE5632]
MGGVPLKTQAARRDGATVFLVPEAECAQDRTELPEGLRLIPVTTLKGTPAAAVSRWSPPRPGGGSAGG